MSGDRVSAGQANAADLARLYVQHQNQSRIDEKAREIFDQQGPRAASEFIEQVFNTSNKYRIAWDMRDDVGRDIVQQFTTQELSQLTPGALAGMRGEILSSDFWAWHSQADELAGGKIDEATEMREQRRAAPAEPQGNTGVGPRRGNSGQRPSLPPRPR